MYHLSRLATNINIYMQKTLCKYIFVALLIITTNCIAKERVINLEINYKKVDFANKHQLALAINDQIPGPTLQLMEGEHVVINVHNKLKTGTTLHWHGVLVPWQMDGVAGVSQSEIPPGGKYKYMFTPLQSGTYWYHAHTGLEEQEGLYGALLIKPKDRQKLEYNKDIVIVLSDWSNTKADQIFANLSSATKSMDTHQNNNQTDYNDVDYDAFLLNGKTSKNPWQQKVNVGDIARIRFIGAGASTIFRVKIPNQVMQVINVQGNSVQPYECNDFFLAPGETLDILLKIQQDIPYLIYAEAIDQSGYVYGALVDTKKINIQDLQLDKFKPTTPEMLNEYYANVIAKNKTNDAKEIYKTINMDLTGSMHPYLWTIDNVSGFDAKPIIIEPNKRYRLIINNKTPMPHPMHIHGHWFILRKNQGEYDPLLHTVLVGPNNSIAVDVDTDASGQWFFHCHMLYHMHAGMFRTFQYSTLKQILDYSQEPQDIMKYTKFINRPIIRIDELVPIKRSLVENPMPK